MPPVRKRTSGTQTDGPLAAQPAPPEVSTATTVERSRAAASPVEPRAAEGAAERPLPGADLARTVARVVALPVTVVAAVADDVAATARRPDAVVYWGGLVGMAALGVLEWPVAAAVGVGIAVANGRRRPAARPSG